MRTLRALMPLSFHMTKDVDLSDAMVVIGAPTLGLVGSITTRYLVESLDMQRVGGAHGDMFAPFVLVDEGRPVHPIRVHVLDTECAPGRECKRLVVMTTEFLLDKEALWEVAEALVSWCVAQKANLVVVPDALVTDEDAAELVGGVAATDAAAEFLKGSDIELLRQGMIMGFSGTLLAEAERQGLDLVCLLAASQPDHPDARAAARVVDILDRWLPGVAIEEAPLLERAEEIEAKVQKMREEAVRHAEQGIPSSAPSMYR